MISFQRLGGIAALYQAVAYIVGIVFFIGVVDSAGVDDPAQKVALLVTHQTGMQTITLMIYVVFGIALVVLTLALHERLKAGAESMMQVATALGLIWAGVVIASGMVFNIGLADVVQLSATDPAQAATVWLAIDAVFNGIGGGVEILGGLWTLLVSWAAIRTGEFSRLLNYFGLLVGLVGSLTVVPMLGEVGGMVFGMGQIVWFVELGRTLLSRPQVKAS